MLRKKFSNVVSTRQGTLTMSELAVASEKVQIWLQPLSDVEQTCGPDLEYDNDYLALNLAAAGKPETQFGPAEAPDWRSAFESAAALLDRSRDIRIAIFWLRAGIHTRGIEFLPVGLSLLVGMIDSLWEHVHPMPDPDDNDPYARVNALTQLSEPEMLIDDLRGMSIVKDRAIGELTLRTIEVALGHLPARSSDTELGREQVTMMVDAAVEKSPSLRDAIQASATLVGRLIALANEKLGLGTAPDLRLLVKVIGAAVTVLPTLDAGVASEQGDSDSGGEPATDGAGAGVPQRGLSGAVHSRQEAIRAIDMVCEYLERSEPTNPAPLFLRRARQLIGHNFLQLMKELAPDAMAEVARSVGVDPDSVETPGG
jgi:type VI secretion system protein ImpA